MTAREITFVCIGLIVALAALLAVTTKQIVHSALWLLVSLGALAGSYVVLGQELVGLVQLLVYVGAIVVLVLFALMLTRAPIGVQPDIDTPLWQRVLAVVLGGATTALLAATIIPTVGTIDPDLIASGEGSRTDGIAAAIFGTWVWPFELLSVLLLVALIGAFAVSRVVLHRDQPVQSATSTRQKQGASGANGTGNGG